MAKAGRVGRRQENPESHQKTLEIVLLTTGFAAEFVGSDVKWLGFPETLYLLYILLQSNVSWGTASSTQRRAETVLLHAAVQGLRDAVQPPAQQHSDPLAAERIIESQGWKGPTRSSSLTVLLSPLLPLGYYTTSCSTSSRCQPLVVGMLSSERLMCFTD